MGDTGNQLDVLRAALKASGDVAYDWDLVADEIEWLDGAHLGFGFSTVEPVRTGEAYHGRINPEDLTTRLEYLANYDELTGHYNRTRLREALDHALY